VAVSPEPVPEKPLHVHGAEALGWTDLDKDGYYRTDAPHYDIDWNATGPLIEKYGITLGPAPRSEEDAPPWWRATPRSALCAGYTTQLGPTPLEAVCRLILELHKAGKLKP